MEERGNQRVDVWKREETRGWMYGGERKPEGGCMEERGNQRVDVWRREETRG